MITPGKQLPGKTGESMPQPAAPYRADIVGSFLRPDSIKRAREQFAAGKIDARQLRSVEDAAIRDVVPTSATAA